MALKRFMNTQQVDVADFKMLSFHSFIGPQVTIQQRKIAKIILGEIFDLVIWRIKARNTKPGGGGYMRRNPNGISIHETS